MDKAAAQNLVRETLQGSFNKERFVSLIKNLLNYVEEAPFVYRGQYIFSDFQDSIKLVERIGKYKDSDEKLFDILVVHLEQRASLERARTKQRNFIAKYLKGSRGGVLKDAALVAFVAPSGEDWRFSFIKMEYRFNEQGKIEEEFTPARRYSFLVGQNENSHTAQSRLLPLLLDDDGQPTLKDLEDAFSVEKATKEFFEKYRDLFLRLKEALDEIVEKNSKIKTEFRDKQVGTVDFAKKTPGANRLSLLPAKERVVWSPARLSMGERVKTFPARAVRQETRQLPKFFQRYSGTAVLRSSATGTSRRLLQQVRLPDSLPERRTIRSDQ